MIGLLLGLAVSWATGALLVLAVWRRGWPRDLGEAALALVLGLPAGLLVNSLGHLLWLGAGRVDGGWVVVDVVMLVAAGLAARLCSGSVVRDSRPEVAAQFSHPTTSDVGPRTSDYMRPPAMSYIFAVTFGMALLCAVAAVVMQSAKWPLGEWDALGIWNLKAKLMLLGGGQWIAVFDPAAVAHADYPIGQPLTVARLWRYAGGADTVTPRVVAGLATVWPVLLVALLVGRLRGVVIGAAAGTVTAGATAYLLQGAWQYADHMLAMFVVAALGCLAVWRETCADAGRGGWLILAGLMAGGAAWTKNEGLLLVGLMVAAVVVTAGRGRWRAAGVMLLGAVPGLVAVALVKLVLAEAGSDLLEGEQVRQTAGRLVDAERWTLVANLGWLLVRQYVDVLAVAALVLAGVMGAVVRGPKSGVRSLAGEGAPGACWGGGALVGVIVLAQVAGYVLVYVMLSRDLGWHLQTSTSRLVVQVWPAAVMGAALVRVRIQNDYFK